MQEYLSGKFRKYDYGTAGNMEEYGTVSSWYMEEYGTVSSWYMEEYGTVSSWYNYVASRSVCLSSCDAICGSKTLISLLLSSRV